MRSSDPFTTCSLCGHPEADHSHTLVCQTPEPCYCKPERPEAVAQREQESDAMTCTTMLLMFMSGLMFIVGLWRDSHFLIGLSVLVALVTAAFVWKAIRDGWGR